MSRKRSSTCNDRTVKCLVCNKPTSVMHMEVNICRACTVFYKRYYAKADNLRCVIETRTCVTYGKNVFWCRRCRLDRLESVLKASRGEVTACVTSPVQKEATMVPLMLSSYQPTNENSIIDRIRANHRTLSLFRLSTELKHRGIVTNPANRNEEDYILVPGTYQFTNCGVKYLIVGLFGFIESSFPEFQTLDVGKKWILVQNFYKIFHCIDSPLRTERRLGKEAFHIYSSYTTYVAPQTADQFFSDCPDLSQVGIAAQTLRAWIQEVVPTLRTLFHQIEPTEDEFFALMGLAFWSLETFDATAELLALASRYRSSIINELMVKYRYSIGEENGSTRVGSLLCLIQEIRRLELNLRSDFELYRLLGAFDDGTLAYRLQLTHV